MLATSMLGCPGTNGPDGPTGPVSKDFTQDDVSDITSPSDEWGVYKAYSLSEFAGKEVTIDFSCDLKVINTGDKTYNFQWQVNESTYPVVAAREIAPEEDDWVTVKGSNEKPIKIENGYVLYLSNYEIDADKVTISIRNVKYTVTYEGAAEPEKEPAKEYPTEIFTVGEAGTCGLKVGDKDLIPFSQAIQFEVNGAQDAVYNADGSVTWTAKASGGAGGGVAFYFDADKSIINTANYDSVDLEFVYSPVTGYWTAGATVPSFCLRLLTYDSTGVFGGAVDAEYFNDGKEYGTAIKTVKFSEAITNEVVKAADFDGLKGFVLKFDDYEKGLTDGDLLKIQLKKVTFNRKANAPADAPYDDGLTDAQRGKVYSIYYDSKDYVEFNAKQDALAKATTDEEKAAAEAMTVEEYKKHAWVYTPAGYDPEDTDTKYPVMVLMHGFAQDENTWGLSDKGDGGRIKGYMDRGIADGSVKPFILIVATGKASKLWKDGGNGDWANMWAAMDSYNAFDKELRYDVIPYMRANYNIAEGRDNVAMAGLSMGASQTFNIGLRNTLDLISYFGAFSFSAPTVAEIEESMKQYENNGADLNVNYLYSVSGTNDGTVNYEQSYKPSMEALKVWDKLTYGENFTYDSIEGGTHDFPVWFAGFKKFITIVFQK